MKTNLLSITVFLFLLALAVNVSALGVTPGRTTINYEHNLKREITFTVLNNEHKSFDAVVYAEGELAKYIKIKEETIHFNASEDQKEIKYKLHIRGKGEKCDDDFIECIALECENDTKCFIPGIHKANVIVREISENAGKDIHVGATVSVASQLFVIVPYPGKYAVANVYIPEDKTTNKVKFYVQVENMGTENINKIKAKITIKQGDKSIIGLNTNEQSLRTRDKAELSAEWIPAQITGKFTAEIVINYDGEEINIEKNFAIGASRLSVLDVTVKNFKLGGIAKFDILVENKNYNSIEDAYAEMTFEKNDDQIAQIKSSTETIELKSKKALNAYWDTENVKQGVYNSTLILHYEDIADEVKLITTVTLNEIKVSFVGPTGEVIAESTTINKQLVLTIIILVLILANIIWFVYFKKIRKKKEK